MQKLFTAGIGSLFVVVVGVFLGCEPAELISNLNEFESFTSTSTAGQNTNANFSNLPERSSDKILLASFNIQSFGRKKMGDPWVMERLAAIVRQFDVVAVQEIREKDQVLMPEFLRYINAAGANYDFLLSPRLGRSVSQEQYAYIYDANRILADPKAAYLAEDGATGSNSTQRVGRQGAEDLLHREPYVARFTVNMPQDQRPFRFSLVNMHTDPDIVDYELDVLAHFYVGIRNYEYGSGEDDVILLGDLNAAPDKFGKLGRVMDLIPLVTDEPTNVRQTKLYDNILIDGRATREFTGRAGVLNFTQIFQLTQSDALRLSDHFPVWAEFSVQETPQNFASLNFDQRKTVR